MQFVVTSTVNLHVILSRQLSLVSDSCHVSLSHLCEVLDLLNVIHYYISKFNVILFSAITSLTYFCIVQCPSIKEVGHEQWWAKLLRLLTVNSLSYFVKIKY